MATKEGMSGVDAHAVVAEWQKFLPLWVSKIYQFSSSHIVIRLNGQEHARHLLALIRVHDKYDFIMPHGIPFG